jgi:autotransporter translocation and assembly factor TamB
MRRAIWLIVAAIAVALLSRAAIGDQWIVRLLRGQIERRLVGKVEIGRLSGDIPSRVRLRDVVIYDQDGNPAIRIGELELGLRLRSLMSKRIELRFFHASQVSVHARALKDGRLNLAALLRPSNEKSDLSIVIANLILDGEAAWQGRGAGSFHFEGGLTIAPELTTLVVTRMGAQLDEPGRAVASAAGTIRFGDRLEGVSLDLRTSQLGRLAGDERIRGDWQVKVLAHGPMKRLNVDAQIAAPRGQLHARGELGVGKTLSWSGQIDAADLDPQAAFRDAPALRLGFAARARGKNARGTVELDHLLAEAPGARATAQGRIDLGKPLGADLRAHVAASDLSRLNLAGLTGALDGDAHLILRGWHTRIDGDARARALTLGRVHANALDLHIRSSDLESGNLVLRARGVRAPRLALDRLNLRASAQNRILQLTADGSGMQSQLALAAHGRVRHSAAEMQIDRLSLTTRGERLRATEPARLMIGPVISIDRLGLAWRGQRLVVGGRWDRSSDRISAHLAGEKLYLAALMRALQPNRRVPETDASLTIDVSGSRARPIVAVELAGRTVATKEKQLHDEKRLKLRAQYRDERIYGEAHLSAFKQDLNVIADVPTRLAGARPIRAKVIGDSRGLDQLRPYLPARFATLDGQARLVAHIAGTTRHPELDLELRGDALAWGPLKKSRVRMKVDYSKNQLRADGRLDLVGDRPAGTVELALLVPIDLGARTRLLEELEHTAPIDLQVRLNGLLMEQLPLGQLGFSSPLHAGQLSGTFTLAGTLHQPRLVGELTGHRLAAGALHGVDLAARVDYRDDDARLSLQSDLHGAPLLVAHAKSRLPFRRLVDREPWRSSPVDVELVVPAIDVSGGNLSALAQLHGSFAKPWGSISAHGRKLVIGQTRLTDARLEGDFDGATISASLWADQPNGGKLRADAAIPLDGTAPWNAIVRADKVQLGIRDGGKLKQLDGKLEADLSLSGTRAQPLISGAAHLKDGALAIEGDPNLYKNVVIDFAAREQLIDLQKIVLESDGGKLKAHGELRLTGLSPSKLDLTAQLDHLPVAQGPVGAWIDAELSITGQRDSAQGFSGTVTIHKGTAHLPKLAAGRRLQPTGPLKEVVFVDGKSRRERARRRAAEKDEIRTSALLATRVPGPFHIRSPELMTDLDGDLQIEIVGPVVRLTGKIESSGGWIELLGRRYDLERARLGFGGGNEIDPELDVRISRETTDAQIIMEVQGTARHPRVTFSSNPPIYEESQIIGIIVSGDPGSSRVSDRTLDQKVVGALSSVIVGKLKDQIAPGLPIDVLKIDTGDTGYTGLSSTRVEIGKYITENIYISYVHQFGELQIGTRRLNANEASVEWRFKRRFELNTRFGDAGVGALDFFWTFRY